MPVPDDALPVGEAARAAVDAGDAVVAQITARLAASGGPDVDQLVAYDLAHAAAGMFTARVLVERYAPHGPVEAAVTAAFVADALADVGARLLGREDLFGVAPGALDAALRAVARHRSPAVLGSLALVEAPRHLDDDFVLVADTFRRFAEDRVRPHAAAVHRGDLDVPEDVIAGLGELGAFGLSIPEAHGGFATGGVHDHLAMVVATEELSRASLGIGGSLITRPEIVARSLLTGGTDAQRAQWLPRLASGQVMAAVAVTEPDAGSDVAAVACTARPAPGAGGEPGWAIDGVKTWCTFAGRADVLLVLARTDPDRAQAHRGLSLFLVAKERAPGHAFALSQPGGGRLEGRAIRTIGYRGMHSFELTFDRWWVPADALVGGAAGRGRGFHLQMAGFENGRLQTAARAVGVMQAAYEAACAQATARQVFGQPLAVLQLTQVKLARMAVLVQAARQASYAVARLLSTGGGTLEASMVKAYVCRAAEWVTREALQLHGGYGYAEELDVSRLFVDARVLSIFEGADETLAIKVIARRLVQRSGRPGEAASALGRA